MKIRFRRSVFQTTHPSVQSIVACTFIALLVLSSLSGCRTTRTSDRNIVAVDVADAIAAVQGERRGFAGIGGRTSGVWVDARTAEEFREGHIPGAVHMPIERARDEHRMLREYQTIIVYGRDRRNVRATALSKLLMELGHRDVRTLQGGFESWHNADKPVEQP